MVNKEMVDENKKKKFSIDFVRASKFIVALLLINFLVLGFICNSGIQDSYQMDPGARLLFIYTNIWNWDTNLFLSPKGIKLPLVFDFFIGTADNSDNIESKFPGAFAIVILLLIGVYQGYKEDFMVYSIKNNLWMTPFIVLSSLIWSVVAYTGIKSVFQILGEYFLSIHGYLNIIVIAILYTGAGVVGGILKSRQYIKGHSTTAMSSTETIASESPQS